MAKNANYVHENTINTGYILRNLINIIILVKYIVKYNIIIYSLHTVILSDILDTHP